MKNNIFGWVLCGIFAGAGIASAADYQWVGANTNWATASNWNVWNGSAWVTATATPSNGDSILGNTSAQQMNQPAALTLSTLQITTGGVQYTTATLLTVDTLRTTLSNTATGFVIRGNGAVSARLIDIQSGTFSFGSGGNTIGGLTVSQGVVMKGNFNIAASTSAQVGSVVTGSYTLGIVTFSGNYVLSLAQSSTLRGYNLAANATVSGLTTDAGVYGRIYSGNTAVSTATLASAPGSNLANLYINVSGSNSYSGNVGLMDITQTGYLGEVKINTLSITKVGTGTQILTASTSNYTAGTTVAAGTLLANNTAGSGIGYGNAVVQSGARLGGTGIIALTGSNTLTVQDGGILLAGNGAVGTSLTVKNALVLANNAIVEVALGASGGHSTLAIGTGGSLTAGNIVLKILDGGIESGTYANLITGLASNPGVSNWTVSGIDTAVWDAVLAYNAGSVSLTLTAVPEPAMAALAVGLLSLIWVARRRRS